MKNTMTSWEIYNDRVWEFEPEKQWLSKDFVMKCIDDELRPIMNGDCAKTSVSQYQLGKNVGALRTLKILKQKLEEG